MSLAHYIIVVIIGCVVTLMMLLYLRKTQIKTRMCG